MNRFYHICIQFTNLVGIAPMKMFQMSIIFKIFFYVGCSFYTSSWKLGWGELLCMVMKCTLYVFFLFDVSEIDGCSQAVISGLVQWLLKLWPWIMLNSLTVVNIVIKYLDIQNHLDAIWKCTLEKHNAMFAIWYWAENLIWKLIL